ncbi:hypothetical protein ASPVEDRAFT_38246 [Aspergillus versicolor CBS 583.65]|uniref:Uncharacterized protein n=1 Tax=Aspergillus versicolor CBS 583.65 TaxID=1036611 RepID=A0A1L9PB33_ASPVE|nr:uncharacterized protein ASPVEDRAFT_38246 [Aspergillus versicolor CBS 583.65]OJI98739.1 hypothetical protein ASPVEDRAFT_38246 [Aspergillus versicolor CBS 583.65]
MKSETTVIAGRNSRRRPEFSLPIVAVGSSKNLSFYGDRSCQYPEESIMKVAVDSFLGLHRRIQHLVDTPELLGPPVRQSSTHFYYPEPGAEYKYFKSEDKIRSIVRLNSVYWRYRAPHPDLREVLAEARNTGAVSHRRFERPRSHPTEHHARVPDSTKRMAWSENQLVAVGTVFRLQRRADTATKITVPQIPNAISVSIKLQ